MPSNKACIFTSSKYYEKAFADASKIAQPLGSNFLSEGKNKVKRVEKKGNQIRKVLFDKRLMKQLSLRRVLPNQVKEILAITEHKKSPTYLSSNLLNIVKKCSDESLTYENFSSLYCPLISQQMLHTIDFANSFHSNSDFTSSISDYALSKYIVFYDGPNQNNLKHLLNSFDKQFLQYQIKAITTSSFQKQSEYQKWRNSTSFIDFQQVNINNKQRINQLIQSIIKKGKQLDPMNNGVQFFVGDYIAHPKNQDILIEEISNFNQIQAYLYMICNGVLADGQNAIIRIKDTIRHKTIEFLYMYKLIFNKVHIMKPEFSNYLSSERYLLCEGLIQENCEQMKDFLKENFDLLLQHGQQRLLLNPNAIFKEDTLIANIRIFNDTIMTKGIKQILDKYLENTNIQIYPPKKALLEKISEFEDEEVFNKIVEIIQKIVPDEEDIKNQNAADNSKQNNSNSANKFGQQIQLLQQKEADYSYLDFLKETAKTKPIEKPQKKPKINQEDQVEKRLNEQYKQQERIRQEKKKMKKQQEKKEKKEQERVQDPYNVHSHFDYAYD